MDVLITGTGDAFSSRHHGSSSLVRGPGGWIAIDCPGGVLRAWREASEVSGCLVDPFEVKDIILTHLHGDHCGGLETIGFMFRYMYPGSKGEPGPRPRLHALPEVLERTWERLAAAMDGSRGTSEAVHELETYFDPHALAEGGDNPLGLGRYETHDIEAVVDRITLKEGIRSRLVDSVETGMRLSNGLLLVLEEHGKEPIVHRFSEHMACSEHPECNIEAMEPRLFSFNSPYGACTRCGVLGSIEEFDPELVIPDPSLGFGEGAVPAWVRNGKRMNVWYGRQIRSFCDAMDLEKKTPISEYTDAQRKVLLHGSGGRRKRGSFWFEGVLPNLDRRYHKTDSALVRERLHGYMSSSECPECRGARLK